MLNVRLSAAKNISRTCDVADLRPTLSQRDLVAAAAAADNDDDDDDVAHWQAEHCWTSA